MRRAFYVFSAYSGLLYLVGGKQLTIGGKRDKLFCVAICAVTQWEKRCVMFQITAAEDTEDPFSLSFGIIDIKHRQQAFLVQFCLRRKGAI